MQKSFFYFYSIYSNTVHFWPYTHHPTIFQLWQLWHDFSNSPKYRKTATFLFETEYLSQRIPNAGPRLGPKILWFIIFPEMKVQNICFLAIIPVCLHLRADFSHCSKSFDHFLYAANELFLSKNIYKTRSKFINKHHSVRKVR